MHELSNIRERVDAAIHNSGEGCLSGLVYADSTKATDAALTALRDFVRQDTDVAHRVAQYTSLRQAAGETPIKFVQRIVSAYLSEAVGDGWPEEAANDNEAA